MRKIEKAMLNAVHARVTHWRQDNTAVFTTFGKTEVTLHGHRIATVDGDRIHVDVKTLANWPTRTTMSRLRALGVDVCQHNHTIYLDGAPL